MFTLWSFKLSGHRDMEVPERKDLSIYFKCKKKNQTFLKVYLHWAWWHIPLITSTQEAKAVGSSEFEANLGYGLSSRTAKAVTQRSTVLKNTKQNKSLLTQMKGRSRQAVSHVFDNTTKEGILALRLKQTSATPKGHSLGLLASHIYPFNTFSLIWNAELRKLSDQGAGEMARSVRHLLCTYEGLS